MTDLAPPEGGKLAHPYRHAADYSPRLVSRELLVLREALTGFDMYVRSIAGSDSPRGAVLMLLQIAQESLQNACDVRRTLKAQAALITAISTASAASLGAALPGLWKLTALTVVPLLAIAAWINNYADSFDGLIRIGEGTVRVLESWASATDPDEEIVRFANGDRGEPAATPDTAKVDPE